MMPKNNRPAAVWTLGILTLVYTVNIADRFVLSTFIEPIKAEFHLSDSAVGFLTGVSLALFYVTAGIPLGVLADRVNRRNMIAVALAIWSVMTALCGIATGFFELLLARIGVGIGEAGGTPPSQSMLADCFPSEQRIVAMSIFALGIPLGSALGGIAGGIMAEHFGWRTGLFILAGASLPVLILLIFCTEPKRGLFDRHPDSVPAPSLIETLKFIRMQPSLFHILCGSAIATFSGMGLVWWTPAFLMRVHGLSVGEAGTLVGLMSGAGGLAAMGASALVMLFFTRSSPERQCRYTALVTLLIVIPAVVAHLTDDRDLAIGMLWLFIPFTNVYVGPTLALLQNLAPASMRGAIVAIVLFTANIANLAIAPQVIGIASDLTQSLSLVLAFSALTGIWAAYHYWAATRTLNREISAL